MVMYFTVHKFGVSKIFFVITLMKLTVNTFIMLQKISISNRCHSSELSIHLKMLNPKILKILCSTTVFNIDNNQKCFLSSKSVYYYDF